MYLKAVISSKTRPPSHLLVRLFSYSLGLSDIEQTLPAKQTTSSASFVHKGRGESPFPYACYFTLPVTDQVSKERSALILTVKTSLRTFFYCLKSY